MPIAKNCESLPVSCRGRCLFFSQPIICYFPPHSRDSFLLYTLSLSSVLAHFCVIVSLLDGATQCDSHHLIKPFAHSCCSCRTSFVRGKKVGVQIGKAGAYVNSKSDSFSRLRGFLHAFAFCHLEYRISIPEVTHSGMFPSHPRFLRILFLAWKIFTFFHIIYLQLGP